MAQRFHQEEISGTIRTDALASTSQSRCTDGLAVDFFNLWWRAESARQQECGETSKDRCSSPLAVSTVQEEYAPK